MPKIHSLVVKIVYYLKESFTCIFWAIVRLNWPSITKKRAKNGQKKAYQNKIVYFEAKYDFQVPKILNLLIKTVCYLKE